jgi:hypothetical protein
MKIKLNGCFGKQEILERLASVLNTMEDNGITEFRDIDIELTPLSSGCELIPSINAQPIGIRFDSSNRHVIKTRCSRTGKSLLVHSMGVNGASMNLDKRLSLMDNVSYILKNEFIDRKNMSAEERVNAYRIKTAEILDSNVRYNAIISKCRDVLLAKLNITHGEYSRIKSSDGIIKSKGVLKGYTDTNVEGEVFRISLKVEGTGRKDIYLFTEEGKLIYERVISQQMPSKMALRAL